MRNKWLSATRQGKLEEPGGNARSFRVKGENRKPPTILSSEGKQMSLTDDDKNWIARQLERVETSLLTEFHKWASPIEQRMRTHREAIRALDLEYENLNERVAKLEPPQQH